MKGSVRILGIPGSLRKASFNRAALGAAQELVPTDAVLEIVDLDGIPPFSEDDERSLPAGVVELKTRIREADSILIATPEYNYSVPGVLKNAIDWASRPYGDSAWDGIDKHATRIEPGLSAGDEVGVIAFLRASVEPLLDHLSGFGDEVQGVRGLRALRVGIDLTSPRLEKPVSSAALGALG
jgi:chromate reductase